MAKRHDEILDEPSPERNRQLHDEYALLRFLIEDAESDVNQARAAIDRERQANEAHAMELDDREHQLMGLKRDADEARAAATVAKKALAAREKELRALEAEVLGHQQDVNAKAGQQADDRAAVTRERQALDTERKQLALDRAQLEKQAAELAGLESDHTVRRGGKR